MTTSTKGRFRIRQAGFDDLVPAAEMKAVAWRQAYSRVFDEHVFVIQQAGVERTASFWETDLNRGAYFWLVTDSSDGSLAGIAHACVARDDDAPTPLELAMIYLLDTAKGSGIADRLLEMAIGDAPAFLWVLDDNPRAHAFYRRHGFVPDAVTRALPERYGAHVEQRWVRG